MIPNNIVVVDVETSGINPYQHQLLAVGLCPLWGPVEPATIFVKHADITWSPRAKDYFRGYQAEWEQRAVAPARACADVENYFARVSPTRPIQLVGHNAGFDVSFLKQLAFLAGKDELAGASHRFLDSYTMLFLLNSMGLIPSSALTSDGAFMHFGIRINESQRHTAIGDALATRELVRVLLERFDKALGIPLSPEQRALGGR
jgi:DNA polymerase III epsilon subunit-like protein